MLRVSSPLNRQLTITSKDSGVGYRSKSSLKKLLDWDGVEDSAYEPLCLIYRVCQIDPSSKTKQIIPDEDIQDREMVAKDFREKRFAWEVN